MDVERRNQAIHLHNEAIQAAATDKQLAYRLFGSAVDVDGNFFDGWKQVGRANGEMNLLHGAIAAFRRALELNPNDVQGLVDMGHRMYHLGDMRGARKATERAIEIEPENAYAIINLSLIESVDGNLKKALSLAKRAFEIDRDPVIETGLAFAYLFAGDFENGLRHFEARFPYKLPQFLSYPYPQWRGEDIAGKTLFIQAEQGLGDTLRFLRFLPLAAERAAHIVFCVQPELVRLLRGMLAVGWPNVEIIAMPSPFPVADFWSTPHSLPVALGLSNDEIISRHAIPVPEWPVPAPWKAPDRKLHIGIAWQGAMGNDIDRHRSVKIERFLELYRVPGIQLYSLQVGKDQTDILHAMGLATLTKDLSPYIRDVADTVAIIRDLDLVITVESSVGHMAALVEKECWVVYGWNGGDFQLSRHRKRPVWYDNSMIFRQGPDCDWGPVFDRVVDALKQRMAT